MKMQDFKIALLFLILGFATVIIGALCKVLHWPYGNIFILVGGVFEVIAAIYFMIVLFKKLRK